MKTAHLNVSDVFQPYPEVIGHMTSTTYRYRTTPPCEPKLFIYFPHLSYALSSTQSELN